MFELLRKEKSLNFKVWTVLFALSLSSILFSIDIPNFERAYKGKKTDFEALELKLQGTIERKGQKAAREEGYQLAQTYLKQRRPQEALWTLREFGYFDEANEVQSQLESFLVKTRSFKKMRELGYGVAPKGFYNSVGGIQTIAKWWNEGNAPDIRYEIVAYEIDKLAGFDIVPVTVKRKFGNKSASAQYIIKDSETTGINIRDAVANASEAIRVHTLDRIIGNFDRHGSNWLFRPGRLPVAIDHSHADPYRQVTNRLRTGIDDKELKEVAKLLGNLTPEKVKKALLPLLNPNEIQAIQANIENVKQWYVDHGFPVGRAVERNVKKQNPGAKPAPKFKKQLLTAKEFDEKAKIVRRGDSPQERSAALRTLIKVLSDKKWRKANLKEVTRSKRLAHIMETSSSKFPKEVLKDYNQAISRLADRAPAHERAKKQCRLQLAQMGERR